MNEEPTNQVNDRDSLSMNSNLSHCLHARRRKYSHEGQVVDERGRSDEWRMETSGYIRSTK